MAQAQSYNYIYLIFIAFIVTNTVSTMLKKKRIGKKLIEIEKKRGITKYLGAAVITIAVIYMFRITILEYNLATEQALDRNKTIFNLIVQLLFWISFYISLMYSQFGKNYIGEHGLAVGSKGITWEQIDRYSWSKDNLIITIDEKFLTKNSKKDAYLTIPEEKVKEVRDILVKKVVKKFK